jgi:SP family general alpha glucoside:H+ symporter-like MFS transporter
VAPYILNPQWANWRGKAGFLTAGLTMVSFTWAFFRLPETGKRTFEELDILFTEKGMTARKFSKAVILREGENTTVKGPPQKRG